MPKTKSRSRLSHAAALGLKELPSNTAWLIGKAWQPATAEIPEKMNYLGTRVSEAAHSAAESAGPTVAGARRKVSDAGRMIADVVPAAGQESVAEMLHRADEAAEQAREVEAAAVRLAQQAKDEADAAAKIAAESDLAMKEAQVEARELVKTRMERAEREAGDQLADLAREHAEKMRRAQEHTEQQLADLRQAEEEAAQKALKKIETESTSRTQQAQRRAERSQEEAGKVIREANDALVKAQQLADEAAQAAQEAASEANREAERLAEQAKERATDAKRRAVEAQRVRERAGKSVGRVRGNGQLLVNTTSTMPKLTGDDLEVLAKQDLLRLAQELDVEGRASMSKPELLDALENEGVPPATLTKRELLNLGESWGLEVRASMSKAELVQLIDSHTDN
jgi:hypothetical protein